MTATSVTIEFGLPLSLTSNPTVIAFAKTWPNQEGRHIKKGGRRKIHIHCVFERAADGGYVARCPALPGPITEGDNLAEGRRVTRSAHASRALRKDCESIPSDLKLIEPVKETIRIANPAWSPFFGSEAQRRSAYPARRSGSPFYVSLTLPLGRVRLFLKGKTTRRQIYGHTT